MKSIPIELWGRDHWSTFAFIETQCVDSKEGVAIMEQSRIVRMRCNPSIHPQFAHEGTRMPGGIPPTRLQGDQTLDNHDDWSCLDDAEAAGLLTNEGSGLHRMYKLTPLGMEIASRIRKHKASGGSFSTFKMPPAAAAVP